MLKLNQLQAFNEVMLTGSISQAARHLHRTQSSISATIAGIEDDLQMKLFERRGGRVHPVPEARYLHSECGEILRRLETVSENMHRIRSLQTGELNIATMPGPSVFFLPNLIANHGLDHPNVRTNVVSRSSEGVYRLMAGQRYDIGLADYIPEFSTEATLINTDLFEFRCLCVVLESHPLATNDTVTPQDLSGVTMATLGEEHAVHGEIHRVFAQFNFQPNIRHTTQYFLSLFTYVEQGLACAIVDPVSLESYRLHKNGDVRLKVLGIEPEIPFRMGLITPKHRPASTLSNYFHDSISNALERVAGKFGR